MNPWRWDWAADCPWNSRSVVEAGAEEPWISTLPYLPIETSRCSYGGSEGHLFPARVRLLQRWKLLWCHDQPLSLPGSVSHAHQFSSGGTWSFPEVCAWGVKCSLRFRQYGPTDAPATLSPVSAPGGPRASGAISPSRAPQLSQRMVTPSIWSQSQEPGRSFPPSPPLLYTQSLNKDPPVHLHTSPQYFSPSRSPPPRSSSDLISLPPNFTQIHSPYGKLCGRPTCHSCHVLLMLATSVAPQVHGPDICGSVQLGPASHCLSSLLRAPT